MIVNYKVRGTMITVIPVEVNVDTVYIRSNVIKIEDENFTGWEYDETQYDLKEYIGSLAEKQLIDQLMIDNINMQTQIDNLIAGNL